MNDQSRRIQAYGICSLLILVAAAATWKVRSGHQPPVSASWGDRDPEFQIDVLDQEAGAPGRMIHVKRGGVDIFSYTCQPDDASVAVFTMRDIRHGLDLGAVIRGAQDADRNSYLVGIESEGPVKLMTLKRGFARKPAFVNVTIGNGTERSRHLTVIPFTKIAEPERILPPISVSQAEQTAKTAQASMDDARGAFRVRVVSKLPPDEFVRPALLALTYGPWKQPVNRFVRSIPPLYCSSTESARVRLDHYRTIVTTTTLTYRNARIVQTNGRNILLLPTTQSVGEIKNRPARIAGLAGSIDSAGRTSAPAPQVIDIACDIDPVSVASNAVSVQRSTIVSSLEISSISPTLKSMGIERLKVAITNPQSKKKGIGGRARLFISKDHMKTPESSVIPELKITVRTASDVKVSSEIQVLPVRHVQSSSMSLRMTAVSIPLGQADGRRRKPFDKPDRS